MNNFPLELIDFIHYKLRANFLTNIYRAKDRKNKIYFIFLTKKNRKMLGEKNIFQLIEINDLQGIKYLHENGVDITTNDNCTIKWASRKGHLEVVKYLHENGADITADNNYAIRSASKNGHLEVVKYLHINGADITADNNYAIKWASRKGHLEVVKYLNINGADITADNNYAIGLAS